MGFFFFSGIVRIGIKEIEAKGLKGLPSPTHCDSGLMVFHTSPREESIYFSLVTLSYMARNTFVILTPTLTQHRPLTCASTVL